MTDLDEPEVEVDAILRSSASHLRTAISRAALPEFHGSRRPRRRSLVIAVSTVVVVLVGLVAIGTNHNDRSLGNDQSRLHWQITKLPEDLTLVFVSEPGSQTGPPGATVMVNVYATDAAPLGPIVSVRGTLGLPDLDIVPALDGTNFQEATAGDRRAAFADGQAGQRLLYVEVDSHWVEMRSRNVDDATLSEMARSVVRDADGVAAIPTVSLLDGLTLVLPADAPAADLGLGSNFSGVSYGDAFGRSIGLQVSPSRMSPRANLGLQAAMSATRVAGVDGFIGGYSTASFTSSSDNVRILSWERDGLDFRLTGFTVTDEELMTAAESVERASDSKWREMLRQTGADQDSSTVPAGTEDAVGAPADTDPPFTGDVRDVSMDVRVSEPSINEQIWSGTLPTGETWHVEITRVFDSIAMKPKIDGAEQGMSYGPLVRAAGEAVGCCGPISVVTADPDAASLRVTTHDGDRFAIPLHDLPGTDFRIAVIALAGGSGPVAAELIDSDGNVLESLPGGS
jgi:hypothetical protein